MEKSHITFLSETFLFEGIEINECTKLLEDLKVSEKKYSKGDIIYSPNVFQRCIGFVFDGECLISRDSSTEHPIPLNTVKKGSSFGITSVFSQSSEFPTVVTAKSFCTILFLDYEILSCLIHKNYTVAMNVIRFLTERIEFLNYRIAAFSGMSVEEKLINHILGIHKRTGMTEFDFNKKHSAEAISCGRASLYRAMESLQTAGYVKFDNKKIYITDLEGLERMSK